MSSPRTSNKTLTDCPSSGPAARTAVRHQASSTIPGPPEAPGTPGQPGHIPPPSNPCELLFDYLPRQSFPHTTLLELDRDPPRSVPARLLAGLHTRELGVVEIAKLLQTEDHAFYGLTDVSVPSEPVADLGLRPGPVPQQIERTAHRYGPLPGNPRPM